MGLPPPQLVMVEEPAYQRFARWASELLAGLAIGDQSFLLGARVRAMRGG